MQNWFSKHPEAINEQEKLVIILEHAGYDLRNIIQEDIGFTLFDASRLVSKACSKAWTDKLPVATSGFKTEKQFIQKITGAIYFEHVFDGVVNSRRFSALLPSGWVKSVHRAEFGIPESERGNPDRIIFDSKDKLQSLLSCKHLNDYKKQPDGLDKSFTWAMTDAENYAHVLGMQTGLVPRTSLFTTGTNPDSITWKGGLVSYNTKGNSVQDLLDKNTETTLEFWRDFWAEIKLNVEHHRASQVVGNPDAKVPDFYQKSQVVTPLALHTGPGIVNADCGTGKTVMQIACFPTTRSISLYMGGARLALASQADGEFTKSWLVENHRAYVMSRIELEKQVGRHIISELSHRASDPMDLAQHIFEYVKGNDYRPFMILALEQSLIKVPKALEIIRDGLLVNPDTGELYDWCNDSEKVSYWWNKTVDLLEDAHYDEAHNLVAGDLKENQKEEDKRKTRMLGYILWMNELFRRSTYWTATLKVNGSKYDMRNTSFFGQVVAVIRPADSIARGYTVPPQIIPVRLSAGALIESGIDDKDADADLTYFIKALEDAKDRCDADKQPCRIIIFTNGTTYHESFKQKIVEYFTNKETHVWCEYVQAGTETSRRDTLFKQFGSADFSVLLNHNIVSEGINIPSCSGVILGRFMSAVTLIQAIGRARRIIDEDRHDLKTGKLVPGEWKTYRKKTGLVYTFVDEGSADNLANEDFLRTIISEMRDVNDGNAWWVGPEFGNVKNKGRKGSGYDNPQDPVVSDEDGDAEYDQKYANLLYVDPEVLERLFKEEELLTKIENFDLKDPKALDKLLDIVYN
jgi:hypothetical protein